MNRKRGDREPERFPDRGGGVEIRHEVPEVVEAQLPGGRALAIGDSHVALI